MTRLPTMVGRPSAQCSTALSWIEVSSADLDVREVAAQHGAEPDVRAVADAHVADQHGGRREPDVARRSSGAMPSSSIERRHQPPGERPGSRRSRAAARPSRWSSDCSSAVWARLSASIAAAQVDVGGELEQALGGAERERGAGAASAPRARARTATTSSSPASSLSSPAASAASRVEVVAAEQDLLRAREAEQLDQARQRRRGSGTRPSRPSRNSTRARGEPTRQSQASASARPGAGDHAVDRGDDRLLEPLERLDEVREPVRDVAVGPRVVQLVEARRGRRPRRTRRPRR